MKFPFFKKETQLASPINKNVYAKHSYSQEGEDMILAELLLGQSTGFYVDIGAYHPHRFSNTQFFYELGFRGINIEPSPDAIAIFQKERPEDINLNLGVSSAKSELTYYMFAEAALNTFDLERVKLLERDTPYRSNSNKIIPVDRLDSILKKYSRDNKIDFMNIDVEWHEMQVLESNDWNLYRPQILLIEILDFQLDTILSHPLHIYLRKIGYKFECKTPRTCFYIDENKL